MTGAAVPAGGAALIDGKAVAAEVVERVARAGGRLAAETGVQPGLAVVIVGEDPASQVYVRSKGRQAEACGFLSRTITLPADTPEAELLSIVSGLNADPAIHGILVQMPLPKHIDAGRVIAAVDPDKDVDGFHPLNVGRLAAGELDQALVPCTPAGAVVLARSALAKGEQGADLSGLDAVVLGRSGIVGKPMAQLLLAENCTVTIAHSKTRDLPELCRRADILVAAVGRPEMVKGDWVKPGAVVIDVGINRVTGSDGKSRLVGDVDLAGARERAGWITPVPGGVGPMTIAMLMANTLTAAARRVGRPDLAGGVAD